MILPQAGNSLLYFRKAGCLSAAALLFQNENFCPILQKIIDFFEKICYNDKKYDSFEREAFQ